MADYYDLVLGAIPLTVAGIGGSLVLAGLTAALAVALASTVAAGIVGHAMFVRTPGGDRVGAADPAPTGRASRPGFDAAD